MKTAVTARSDYTSYGKYCFLAPTCVLINPDGLTLHSFGFEAQYKYAELAAEDASKDWYYFKSFSHLFYDRLVSVLFIPLRWIHTDINKSD